MKPRLAKKLDQDTSARGKEPCFVRDERSEAHSFALSGGTTWVFPIRELIAGHRFESGATVRLSYKSAEVVIKGANLERILEAAGRGDAFHLRSVRPGWQGAFQNEVFVSGIEVVVTDKKRKDDERG